MTDVEIENPSELIAKNGDAEVSEQKQSDEMLKESIAPEKTEPKRHRYDGRSKKRRWVFDRRDDNVKRERTAPEDRVKRRKYLMVLGYAGANYIGMQRNPDVNTIEEELLKAMFKHKLITEESFNQPQYSHFQRAARTDKGVSAARQCISLKLRKSLLHSNSLLKATSLTTITFQRIKWI